MSLVAILTLGFFLGMRHATDADHVVAVSTIVSRERSLRAAAPIGILWGFGHTITIIAVGGAIIFFGATIPPRVGLSMELAVGLMLVLLGALNLRNASIQGPSHHQPHTHRSRLGLSWRPLAIGVVHGLAGSAAVALLVLGTIRNAWWGFAYLCIFGAGTIGGMLLITSALALPIVVTAKRFGHLNRVLGFATGAASVLFGIFLVYQIGFAHGLFTQHPQWTPG
jgi:hypothetical protein